MQRRHRSRRLGLETMARGARTAADAIHVPRVEALGARLIPPEGGRAPAVLRRGCWPLPRGLVILRTSARW